MENRVKILPTLIVMCSVGFLFKSYDAITGINAMGAIAEPAAPIQQQGANGAQAGGNTQPTPNNAEAQAQGNATAPQNREQAATPMTPAETGLRSQQGQDVFDPLLMDEAEIKVLQDLADRRKQLDARENELETREKLLLAVEKNIDDKIQRLEVMQAEISDLVTQYDEAKTAQYEKLVKTYETMKPKDAARIMEGMDLDIQIIVATRMKEKSIAPILANMNPEKARQLTIELATWADLNAVTNQ